MKQCRECKREISEQARMCPHCGAPYPVKEKFDGYGFEYKSKTEILSLPLIHISFKYRPNFMPVPAKGIISIGQFGFGLINISQFGIGLISAGQFIIGGYVLAQFAIAYSCIAQIGWYVDKGYGQVLRKMPDVLAFVNSILNNQ
ncbi:MAG: zinc ribbon domain-containing protein [Elusimicrobia bacterium]|nr:zinc ribbon domain-containing protein [Elusimicrobiota bacterium]